MASNQSASLIECSSGSPEELSLESKTLPCLHSLCRSCLERGEVIRAMERDEVIKATEEEMADDGSLHQKAKESYCEQCNVCLCDTCYQNHSAESPRCSSRPLSVREEAVKQKSLGPTLAKEMDDLKMSLEGLIERTKNCAEELNADCDSKCQQLWEDFEEMRDTAERKMNELCEEVRRTATEQVKKWRRLLDENERILKQLEIWRLNLNHLMSESHQDMDVVCGLRMLGSKLSAQLQKPLNQSMVRFPTHSLQILKHLQTEMLGPFGSVSLVNEKEWHLRGLNLFIPSICVSEEDDHVFLCNYDKKSIMEFTEEGDFVGECLLDHLDHFVPHDMCSVSPDIFVVAGSTKHKRELDEGKIIFLERTTSPPFLQIKKSIDDLYRRYRSVILMDKTILVCDDRLVVHSFTKEGGNVRTIASADCWENIFWEEIPWPRIRADLSTGNFWMIADFYELYCFNPKGKKIKSMDLEDEITDFWMDEAITDFCVTELGHFYFCTCKKIFSAPPQKFFYKFVQKSEVRPRICLSKNKIFVSLRINNQNLIKVLEIFD